MNWRQTSIGSCRPSHMRKMHPILMTINFLAFFNTIFLVSKIGKTSGVTGPHIPFSCSLCNPFCQDLARSSTLGNAKSKHTGFECISHAWHRAYKWIPIRSIRNWSVYYFRYPRFSKKRDSFHRVFHIPFQSLKVIWV